MKPIDVLSQLYENYLYGGGCQMYPDEDYIPEMDHDDDEELYEDD